jgi:CheY-like chemotaxis protein
MENESGSGLTGRPLRIMVVDDDPVVHLIMRRTASKLPFNIELVEVLQPVLGIERYRDFQPDVLLVDINMPQMTGWQFLENLGATDETCRVYVFSSSIDPLDREKAKTFANVADYVIKPLSKEGLARLCGMDGIS